MRYAVIHSILTGDVGEFEEQTIGTGKKIVSSPILYINLIMANSSILNGFRALKFDKSQKL
jgi:hypothetical protein